MEVEAWGVNVAGAGVAELDAGVGLVGGLVLGEADVSVDAEEGAAGGAGVGDEVPADFGEADADVFDEGEGGFLDFGDVAVLVGGEPVAVVVVEVPEEGEEFGGEGWCFDGHVDIIADHECPAGTRACRNIARARQVALRDRLACATHLIVW